MSVRYQCDLCFAGEGAEIVRLFVSPVPGPWDMRGNGPVVQLGWYVCAKCLGAVHDTIRGLRRMNGNDEAAGEGAP